MENAVAWIRFQQTFGRGSTRGQDLLTRLGHPCALFGMSGDSLAASGLVFALLFLPLVRRLAPSLLESALRRLRR